MCKRTAGGQFVGDMFATYFKRQIYTQFLPPKKRSNKVIILCAGMPTIPCRKDVMEFYAQQGYWVFFPRYRGTWESGGKFLKKSPHEDVLDVVSELGEPFQDVWSKETFSLNPKEVFVIGTSFGGAVALLASRDERVAKVVALSPVVDWTKEKNTDEPLDELGIYLSIYLNKVYRGSKKDWEKLKTGKFFNPMSYLKEYSKEKILLLWASDDTIVDTRSIIKFCSQTGIQHKAYKRGGHYGTSVLMEPKIQKRVEKFLRK
jgi:alpha-beta hydrolase superfamily lysophospholipase